MSKEEWERKLAAVDLRKDDLNQLVMNFLVTEVGTRQLCPPSNTAVEMTNAAPHTL